MILKVFTDGACSNNGKVNAKAGIGIYFGSNDPRNVSKRVPSELRQTNNVAELLAIIEVFSILKDEIKLYEKIIIYSDSKYSIRWGGEYGSKCEKYKWENKVHSGGSSRSNSPIPNFELGKKLYLLCKSNPNVILKHIHAHTGLIDELSLGNEEADKLANLSIDFKKSPYDRKQKYYLNISYSSKDIGKKYGTKWDPKKKKWYYEGLNTDKNFLQLINLFPL